MVIYRVRDIGRIKNIPHEEVFRGMQILWIDIESLIASAIWATKYEKLFEQSEFFEWFEEFVLRPLWAQDVFNLPMPLPLQGVALHSWEVFASEAA